MLPNLYTNTRSENNNCIVFYFFVYIHISYVSDIDLLIFMLKFWFEIGSYFASLMSFGVLKDARAEDPRFALIENGGEYESVIGFSNLGPRMFALSLQPSHPSGHSGPTSDLTTYPLLF